MKMLTKSYVYSRKSEVIKEIKEGKIFVFPLDNGYCIGCNLAFPNNAKKVLGLTKTKDNVLVVSPNFEWAQKNIEHNQKSKEYMGKLPGPYVIFANLKMDSELSFIGQDIGIRMPTHWFFDFIKESGVGMIALPCKMNDGIQMRDYYSLDYRIKDNVDYVINDGAVKGQEIIPFDSRLPRGMPDVREYEKRSKEEEEKILKDVEMKMKQSSKY
jgi:tRNA A37 threonylcarbamoyladenosine synthetase subunit TsaC/SUA5/YrdC